MANRFAIHLQLHPIHGHHHLVREWRIADVRRTHHQLDHHVLLLHDSPRSQQLEYPYPRLLT